MNITTKFNNGSTVFRMHDNKVQTAEVVTTEIIARSLSTGLHSIAIRYWLINCDGDGSDRVEQEENLFATKAELLASL